MSTLEPLGVAESVVALVTHDDGTTDIHDSAKPSLLTRLLAALTPKQETRCSKPNA